MAGLNNKEVKFAYADSSTIYNQATKLENIIYFIKNGGINIGDTSISNYITKVSELFNDKGYIRDIELDSILLDYPTKTEVEEALANLVNSAPEMLDTLYELAKAIDDNPNFAADIAQELSKKVDKIEGMGLSENDYSDEEKQKLENLRAYITDVLIGRVQTLEDKVDIVENKPAYDITDENIEDWNDAGEKVDRLANVAFTADYNDLINTPQNLSEFNDDTSLNERVGTLEDKMDVVENKPAYGITQENINDWNSKSASVENLHPVAFSGNYNDLENVPTQLSDFTDDTSLNYRVGILEEKTETLEGKVDIIENKPAYNITDENITDWNDTGEKVDQLVDVAFSADYNDLVNVPTRLSDFNDDTSLNERVETLEDKVDVIEGKPAYNITNENITDWNDAGQKVDQLSDVAFSGSYTHLSDVPVKLTDFEDDLHLNDRLIITETSTNIIENKPAYSITDEDINRWDEKQDAIPDLETIRSKASTALQEHQDLSSLADGVEYINDTKLIYLKHGDTRLEPPIDATAFIKDGMVNNVAIQKGTGDKVDLDCLVISFNTDAGKDSIEIPLTDIFNPANYYTKSDIDEQNFLQVTVFNTSYPAAGITADDILKWNTKSASVGDLHKVAFSGNYYDLNNEPTKLSEFTNDLGLSAIAVSGSYMDLIDVPEDIVHDENYVHTDNNYTTAEKNKLESLYNYNDSSLTNRVTSLETSTYILETSVNIIEGKPAYGITNEDINNWNDKQEYISDLQTIRDGAALGATALQKIKTVNNNDLVGEGNISVGTITGIILNGDSMGTEGIVDLGTVIRENQDLTSFANGVVYDNNDKLIYLTNNGNRLPNPIDATDFIKDGMVSDVSIHKGTGDNIQVDCLIISFNTDSGHDDIEIPINRIFNPTNYYTKQDIEDKQYLQSETDPVFSAHIASHINDGSVNYWNNKQDAIPDSSFTYWNNKQDKLTDASISYWNSKQEAINDASFADWNSKQDKLSDASINYWNDKQDKLTDASINYWNNKQEAISDLETIRSGAAAGATALQDHQPIMTINGNTIVGEGNVDISGLPDVTSTDNNKILMVINGEWQMVTPVFVYTGPDAPNNILGNNGDIYLQP